jgi:hypothetical protein
MRRSALALFVAVAGCSIAQAADNAPRNPSAEIAGFELGTRLGSASASTQPQSSEATVEAAGETATPAIRARKVRVVYPVTP